MMTWGPLILLFFSMPYASGEDVLLDILELLEADFAGRGAKCMTIISDDGSENSLVAAATVPIVSLHISAADWTILDFSNQFCPYFVVLGDNEGVVNAFHVAAGTHLLNRDAFYAVVLMNSEAAELKAEIFPNALHLAIFLLRGPDVALVYEKIHCHDSASTRFAADLIRRSVLVRQSNLFRDDHDLSCFDLIATTFDYAPFITKAQDEIMGEVLYDGIEVSVFNAIKEALRFTARLQDPSDGELWGRMLAPGNWSGLAGDLIHKKSDVGFAQLYIFPAVKDLFDFTEAYETDDVCLMVLKPSPDPQWMTIIYALDTVTWMAVVATLIFCLLLVRVFSTMEALSVYKMSELIIAGYLDVSRPQLKELRSLSVKFFFAIFFLCLFVITKFYKSSFVSNLSVPRLKVPMDSLAELADNHLPIKSLTDFSDQLGNSQDPVMQTLSAKYSTHKDYKSAFLNASRGELVMAEGRNFLDFNIRKQFTNRFGETRMHIMRECLFSFRVAFGLQKDSIFTNFFSKAIRTLQEAGFIGKWTLNELEKTAKLAADVGLSNEARAWAVTDLQVAFIVFGFLLVLDVVVLSLEVCVHRRQRGVNNQTHLKGV